MIAIIIVVLTNTTISLNKLLIYYLVYSNTNMDIHF